MKEQPNYFAIIPAVVRYNEKLTPRAILLYGEITALCNEKGFCWATNKYFADLYKVSKKSVSTWIKSLIDEGLITSEIKLKEGSKEVESRYLRLFPHPMEKNFPTPMEEKVTGNST